jgi:hypothetical protein
LCHCGDFDKCGGDIDGGDFAVGRFDLHSMKRQQIFVFSRSPETMTTTNNNKQTAKDSGFFSCEALITSYTK